MEEEAVVTGGTVEGACVLVAFRHAASIEQRSLVMCQ